MSEGEQRTRRTVAIVTVAVIVALGAGLFALLAGGGSFAQLVAITRRAEEAEVWRTYFVAEDCLIDALTENPDAVTDSIARLRAQTDDLADHVEVSLQEFDGFGTRPWQGNLRTAREAIVAHYSVWEDFLADARPVLQEINSEPSSIAEGINAWLELAQTAIEPISATFEDAGVAFADAAHSDGDRELMETLFIPADVTCTRTAI
jgi:hypothetical protein